MPSDADFIRAVLARPDDDAPRLIYADWLDEQGQSEHAEFIRVQCAIAKMERDAGPEFWRAVEERGTECDWNRLRRRERELRANLGNPFIHIPANVDCVWRRGFVDGVRCTAETWLALLDTFLTTQPIWEVTLTTWPHVIPYRVRRNGHDLGDSDYFVQLEGDTKRVHTAPAGRRLDEIACHLLHASAPQVKVWNMPPALAARTAAEMNAGLARGHFHEDDE